MIYWDACVFLHFVEATPAWMPTIDAILTEVSRTGDLVIVTSTVSVAEVAFAKIEKSGGVLDPAIVAVVDSLWADESVVRLIELDQLIARAARDLMRRSIEIPRHLKPMDAIHLATAQQMKVSDLHTMDEPMKNWNDLGFPVQDPWVAQPRLGI
jgi:predicted nucleic acid-binding protein